MATPNPTEFLRDLLKISSVSGNEQEISSYLKSYLKEHDFRLLPSNIGNVVGIKGQGKPIILISSHMDTVPTDNPYKEEENRIYATGATDCKPSLASMFYSVVNHDWNAENGTVVIAGVVEEEVSTRGVEELFSVLSEHKINPDYAIFGEPTIINRICIGYRGRVALKVLVETEPGHSSSSWGYDNAIEVVNALYSLINNYSESYNQTVKKDGHFYEITSTMTTIHAGEVLNSLPNSASANIDVRIPPSVEREDIQQEIHDLLLSRKKLNLAMRTLYNRKIISQKTKISVEFGACYNGVEVPNNSPVVSSLRWAAYKVLGKKIKLLKKTGSTFMNIIQDHYNHHEDNEFACIVYGPGNPRLEHTNNEYIEIDEYLKSIEIYKKFFGKFFSIMKRIQARRKKSN